MSAIKKFHPIHLLLMLLFCSPSIRAQTTRPEAERKLAHDIYKEFVEIQSGFTTGATTPVAEAAAARLRAAGFTESDIFVGGANPKKANLVVRYHGTGVLKPILLLAHIDVVEARREDWSMDPFQLIERDGISVSCGTPATGALTHLGCAIRGSVLFPIHFLCSLLYSFPARGPVKWYCNRCLSPSAHQALAYSTK